MESQSKISEASIKANLEYWQNLESKADLLSKKSEYEIMKCFYELQLVQNEQQK